MEEDNSPERLQGGEVRLNGRLFRQVPEAMTFDQEMYVMSHLMAAGVHKVSVSALMGAEEAAITVITKAYESGRLFHILAGMLVEEGTLWSRKTAQEVAEFFAGLTDADSKAELRKIMTVTLLAFFVSGDAAFRTSLSSSVEMPKQNDGAASSPTTEEVETSEIGTR